MKASNPTTNRRQFLGTAAAGAAALVTRMAAQSPESRVDILLNEPVGTIAPEIYGHFVEHLGGVVLAKARASPTSTGSASSWWMP